MKQMKPLKLGEAHKILMLKGIDKYLPYLNVIFKQYNMNLNFEHIAPEFEYMADEYNMVLSRDNNAQKRKGIIDKQKNQIVFHFKEWGATLAISLDETNTFSVTMTLPNKNQITIHMGMNKPNTDIEYITCDARQPFQFSQDNDPSLHSRFNFGDHISIGGSEVSEADKICYNNPESDEDIRFQSSDYCIHRITDDQYELIAGDETRIISQTAADTFAEQFIKESKGEISNELRLAESLAPGLQEILFKLLAAIKDNKQDFGNAIGFSTIFEILNELKLEKK